MPEVRCRGLDLHYEEHGSGPPIVGIPGTGLRLTYYPDKQIVRAAAAAA